MGAAKRGEDMAALEASILSVGGPVFAEHRLKQSGSTMTRTNIQVCMPMEAPALLVEQVVSATSLSSVTEALPTYAVFKGEQWVSSGLSETLQTMHNELPEIFPHSSFLILTCE